MNYIVVGASAGLGKAFALKAGASGGKIALIARRERKLAEVADMIASAGGEATVLPCDITEPEQVETAFARIKGAWQRVHVVLNAAGVVEPLKAVAETDADDFRRAIDINVFGTFICCREALRIARDQNDPISIINVSSGAANKAYLNWAAYSSSKAAVDTLTRIAAAENEPASVRIFAVSPGPFESHMQETMRAASESDFPARGKFVQLHEEGKLPSAEEVAEATLRLAVSDWPELSGRIIELRDEEFRCECRDRDIVIDY